MNQPWLKHYDPGVKPKLDYPSDLSVPRLLEISAEKYPDNPAVLFPALLGHSLLAGKLTYRQLDQAANRFANALIALGVKKGDRVAIHLPNTPQFPIAFYGAFKAGAIVIAFNPVYTAPEVERQLNDCGAETIVTLTRFYPLIQQIRAKTKLKRVIVTSIKDYFHPLVKTLYSVAREKKEGDRVAIAPGDHAFLDLLARSSAAPPSPRVATNADDIALLQYTGGTTGIPKGAVLTHRNLYSNVVQVGAWRTDVQPGKEVTMCILPFFHVYGLQVGMQNAVFLGGSMVMFPRFEIDTVLAAIDKYHPTTFPGVPTMYNALRNNPEIKKHDLSSIRVCLSGAAPLPLEVQTQFEKLISGKLVEGYGLTETSPVAVSNPTGGKRKSGSVGMPLPDTDVKIVDPEDPKKEMPLGEVGEVAIEGPQVFQGYWQRADETAKVLFDGWFITGDIGRMDEDGYFYLVERKKDMINVGGFKVFPRDVEEVLFTHPKIQDVSVVGVKDEYSGEVPKAFVVLKKGETATAQEILDFASKNLAKFKVPKSVEFRDALPKTIIGKVLKRTLQEEAAKK